MRRFLQLISTILCVPVLFLGAGANAATEFSPSKTISLSVSRGVLVSLPGAASTIFVAEPEIASYQVVGEDKLFVFGRMPGKTTLFALDGTGTPVYSATLDVSYDTGQMIEALKREFPSLSLKLTSTADGIAVSGKVPSAQVAADVVSMLDSFVRVTGSQSDEGGESSTGGSSAGGSSDSATPSGAGTGKGTLAARNGRVINRLTITMPTQVTIRVRVAEVSRNLKEQLGIKWQLGKDIGMGGSSFLLGLSGSAVSSGATFGAMPLDLGALIDALAVENLVSVLAEPNLSVISGETANFLAGGEIPFPTTDGNGGTGVEFKEFGVLLGITPTILSPQRISLRLRPEVSEPSSANGVVIAGTLVPGFITRRADTTVELASGQSVVIGGLLQNSIINEVSKIPLLGDIPILGALARSTSFQRGETELVIIATAYITEASDDQLMLPNGNVDVPNFFQRMFMGDKPEVGPGTLRAAEFIYY